jgi:transmembrane sensor
MNHNSHTDVDHMLLGRYLAGEASPAEAIQLEEWLSASPVNKQLFEQISKVWGTLSVEQQCIIPDKEAFFQQISNQFPQPQHAKTGSLKKIITVAKIAASIVLITGAALFLFVFKKKQPQSAIAVTRQTRQNILNDTLPDGSVAIINDHSLLQYPSQFTAGKRDIWLNGEAFFNVMPDASKPFIITAGPVHIKVIGTSFNVRENKEAVEVAVKTGVVRMYNNRDSITVEAGKKGIYHLSTQRFSITERFKLNELAYATKIFNFENATLKEIAGQLEKAYSVKIIITNKDLEACRMSSSFDNKTIEYIFEVLAITLNIQYRIEHKIVYISGNSCT